MSTTTRRYASDFARRYFDQGRVEGKVEGKAEGKAEDVLAVLDARGIEVPADVRDTIAGCGDLQQLHTWIRRAGTVDKVHELFD